MDYDTGTELACASDRVTPCSFQSRSKEKVSGDSHQYFCEPRSRLDRVNL